MNEGNRRELSWLLRLVMDLRFWWGDPEIKWRKRIKDMKGVRIRSVKFSDGRAWFLDGQMFHGGTIQIFKP